MVIITRDGVRLNVIARGDDAPQVVLVHGLASNARLWDGVGDRLADLGLPSVAVDLRGHGESDRPDDGFDMITVADDVADVVRSFSDGPVVLAGQSWGGNVVVECAARHPDLVRAVVGVDGGLIALSEDFADMEQVWQVLAPPRFDGVEIGDLERMIRARLDGWPESALSGALANFEVLEDGTARSRLSRERHRLILEGMFRHDPRLALGRVKAPVLMLLTSGSAGRANSLDGLHPELRVEIVDAHHDVHAQFPDRVAGLIAEMA